MRQEALTPQRRQDDPKANPDADEAERVLAELPRIIPALRRGRRINFVIAVGTLTAFLIVGHRTEVNQTEISDNVETTCRLITNNAMAINKFLDAGIEAVRASTDLTPMQKAKQIADAKGLKQSVPVCRKETR